VLKTFVGDIDCRFIEGEKGLFDYDDAIKALLQELVPYFLKKVE